MGKLIRFLSSGFGAGYSPFAPGTFGTVVGIPLYLSICRFDPVTYVGLVIFLIVAAVVISDMAVEEFHQQDCEHIVVDEIVGFLVTMACLPTNWLIIGAGFVLFRIFDILKPYPISYLDKKVKGGIGVVADDLVAGIFANIILQIITQNTKWLSI